MSQYLINRRLQKLGIKPTEEKKKVKPINKVSKRQAGLLAEYNRKLIPFKKKNPTCKATLTGCSHKTTDVHHMKGRGKYLLDVSTWLPTCRNCHCTIEQDPALAKSLGLSYSRLSIVDQVNGKKVTLIEKIK
ncbi:hypothetical protein ACX0G7_09860 [Flavitalea antarctica]